MSDGSVKPILTISTLTHNCTGKDEEPEGENGVEEGREEEGADVEKKDVRPFLEIDVRKLLLNYKIVKSLLEELDGETRGASTTAKGLTHRLSRRMLMHGPLARVVISLMGPRMIRHQMAFMTQSFVTELIRKMFFPIAHSFAEKKFPSNPSMSPTDSQAPVAPPSSPPSHPRPEPGHDCRKVHPFHPHDHQHDDEDRDGGQNYESGFHRSPAPAAFQVIGVHQVDGSRNERQQKRGHQTRGNGDHVSPSDDEAGGDDDDDEDDDDDGEEEDEEIIFQIVGPVDSLNQPKEASASKNTLIKSKEKIMYFKQKDGRTNTTTRTKGQEMRMTGLPSHDDSSSSPESDKDANFPVIFLVSHPDTHSNASSKETGILMDGEMRDRGTKRPAAASAPDGNIGNHKLSSAGSHVDPVTLSPISSPAQQQQIDASLESQRFGFPGPVISEYVKRSKSNASSYDVERASRWMSIAEDLNQFHERLREEKWQKEHLN